MGGWVDNNVWDCLMFLIVSLLSLLEVRVNMNIVMIVEHLVGAQKTSNHAYRHSKAA